MSRATSISAPRPVEDAAEHRQIAAQPPGVGSATAMRELCLLEEAGFELEDADELDEVLVALPDERPVRG